MVSHDECLNLPRPKMQKLVRLTAEFHGQKLHKLFEKIATNISKENQVQSLARDALPKPFRSEIYKLYKELSQVQQSAIAEAVLPAARLKNVAMAPQELSRVFEEIFFTKALPNHIRDWPAPEYLLLRLDEDLDPQGGQQEDSDWLRLAHMTVTFDPDGRAFPTFQTRRFRDDGSEKAVTGVLYPRNNEIYSVGRLDQDGGLRFARLKIRPRMHNGIQGLDLYGLRLGEDCETARPFAHTLYAYQIQAGSWNNLKDWDSGFGASVVRTNDERLANFVPEMNVKATVRLLKGSRNNRIPGGILPRAMR